MPNFESRRKKIFSDDIISEMVRNLTEKILLKNDFWLTFYSLFQKVSKEVFEISEGYILSSSHFVLSLHKLFGLKMMKVYEPFAINYTFGELKIHHRDNLEKINNIV